MYVYIYICTHAFEPGCSWFLNICVSPKCLGYPGEMVPTRPAFVVRRTAENMFGDFAMAFLVKVESLQEFKQVIMTSLCHEVHHFSPRQFQKNKKKQDEAHEPECPHVC